MTEMRRTLLWVVFSMSLVLLWDAWNKHNGHPSMFGPPSPSAPAVAGAAPANPPAIQGTGTGVVPNAVGVAAPGAVPANAPTAADALALSQKIDIVTDVV